MNRILWGLFVPLFLLFFMNSAFAQPAQQQNVRNISEITVTPSDGVYHLVMPASTKESNSVSISKEVLREDLTQILSEPIFLAGPPTFYSTPYGLPAVVAEPIAVATPLSFASF